MNVKCNRAALFEAVQLAASIVPNRTPKPVLQCAKLQAEKDKLIVIATDNEVTIKYTISQVQVAAEGAAVIPADRIAAILRESQDDTIGIEVTDATCEVIGKDSRFRIYGHDPDDFPTVEVDLGTEILKVKADTLRNMIHKVTFAAARESSRYAINGVLWERKGKKLRMVATDGRRLAQVDGDVTASPKEESASAIVPVKTMTVLERILNDPDESIEIGFSGNQVVICTTAVELSGTLVQGRFPNYAEVIPSSCDHKVDLPAELFQSAVRQAALLTNENSRGIAMAFSDGKVRLTSSTPETGDAEINLNVDYKGDQVTVGFNPQYILEMLRVADQDEITFEFTDGKKPGKIRCGKSFIYVIMPVAV